MHPAFSVIFFTTASGAGYGLIALMAIFATLGFLPPEQGLGVAGFGLGFALITAGLLASTFHLGHPERAWRAMSQWRSSWLSREGLLSLITYAPTGLYAIGWIFLGWTDGVWAVLGMAGAFLCLLTIYCTSMIYVSLRTIHAWANPHVSPLYILLGLMTGALLLNALVHLFGYRHIVFDAAVLVLTVQGWYSKHRYWRYIDNTTSASTVESATGLGGKVRLFQGPHTQANYLLQEMGYRVARKHSVKLRRIAVVAAFAIPLLLTIAVFALRGSVATGLTVLAALSGLIGILIERWLFFAEAKHTVTLYYGASAA